MTPLPRILRLKTWSLIRPSFFSSLVFALGTLFLCSCGDAPEPPQVKLPPPLPTPTPVPIPAPHFLDKARYMLVLKVKYDPNMPPDEVSGPFIDMIKKGSSVWGNVFTLTFYVVDSAVRRDVDNETKIYVDLYRPDVKLCWTWKTGSLVKDVDGSVTQLPYTGANPKADVMHLDFKGTWSRHGADQVVLGRKCSVLRLYQDNGGILDFLVDANTGALVDFQSGDGSVTCSVSDLEDSPNPTLFKPPPGAFIDKPDVTPTP